MKENYSIEDLTFQRDGMAVYKVKGKDGLAYALTVLTYTEEIICRLDQVKFEKGLRDLVSLSHRSLTKVTEGGVDERDQQVWVTHRWNAGRPLEDILNRRAVEAGEMLKLQQDADSMIAKLGDRADAVSFNPQFIFLGRTPDGELLTKYVIDYWQWFRDWALGSPFGGGRDAAREMETLLKSLDGGVRTPVSRPAAPAPQAKGPMIVLPGESSGASPSPAPVAEAPASQPVTPAPPKTRKLVTGSPAQAQVPAPVPTPLATPAVAQPPKTLRLVTAAPAPVVEAPAPAARSTVPTMLVTTSVPAHHEPAAAPPAASRAQFAQAPVKAPLSAPRTKTGTTLSSSGSGGGNATMIILGLILALTTVVGVMVINQKKDKSVAGGIPKEEKRDERLGPAPDKSGPEPTRPPRSKPVVDKPEPVEPVLMPKPEPRPFVPITPEKVEPRPAEPSPVEPAPEPRPVVKKLPEVSPEIRPDVTQITNLAAGDTAGLASKINTWVRVKGEVVTTSVDGDWAFTGDQPLIAQLRDGQLAVVKNKVVEVLGWLADERTLVVAEDYDISYPGPGAEAPAEIPEESTPAEEPEETPEE